MNDPREMTDEEVNALANELAYLWAETIVTNYCPAADEPEWYVHDEERVTPDAVEDVGRAVQYLDARGLLERDAENERKFAIRDESEAER